MPTVKAVVVGAAVGAVEVVVGVPKSKRLKRKNQTNTAMMILKCGPNFGSGNMGGKNRMLLITPRNDRIEREQAYQKIHRYNDEQSKEKQRVR